VLRLVAASGSVSPASVNTVVEPSASMRCPQVGAKHRQASRISDIDRSTPCAVISSFSASGGHLAPGSRLAQVAQGDVVSSGRRLLSSTVR
jgi:hypothetical protein